MRRLLAIVAVSASVVASVYLAAPDYAPSALRVAVCPVRIDDGCRAQLADAGVSVSRYERVRFPVDRALLADGGLEFTLPAALLRTARCVEVMDWSDCNIVTCASDPTICALWDAGLPLRRAPQRKCLRAKFDAGLLCPLVDGGSFGDRNVTLRALRANPAQCEECECVVLAGEDPEKSL